MKAVPVPSSFGVGPDGVATSASRSARAVWVRAAEHVADPRCDHVYAGDQRGGVSLGQDAQMIIERASVRDDGVLCSADVGVVLQPPVSMLLSIYQGKLSPRNLDHGAER